MWTFLRTMRADILAKGAARRTQANASETEPAKFLVFTAKTKDQLSSRPLAAQGDR